ncbi:MAG: hypothetical protein ONB44_20880 [candidate division KSB1 bacterium]|nr:hypothetical protein [candidate division KSB1 bacterium]MDZ7304588.1 hypothetical protein [candidate division KSB1 bacterium]MDZ7313618.1 hypothetical protein [candidate division KSB1 bacterium]
MTLQTVIRPYPISRQTLTRCLTQKLVSQLSVFLFLLWNVVAVLAQTTPTEGLRENTPKVHALINAKIVIAPGQVIEKGTVVIRDGLIEATGASRFTV